MERQQVSGVSLGIRYQVSGVRQSHQLPAASRQLPALSSQQSYFGCQLPGTGSGV